MKNLSIIAMVVVLVSPLAADERKLNFSEHLGFGSGAAFGAALAGPVGVVVGGTIGALIVHDRHNDQIIARKNRKLDSLNKAISESRSELARVNALREKTQNEMVALRELLRDLSMTVHFETNSAITAEEYRSSLDAIALASKKIDGIKISVIGHADERGTESQNQKLSEMRAQSVGMILNKAGLPNGIIVRKGVGEAEASDGGVCSYYALDRRVDLRVSFDRLQRKKMLYSVR